MRTLFLFFIITLTTLSTTSQTIEGTYANKWVSSSGEAIEYSLILHNNGRFTFYSTRTYLDKLPEKKVKAKGTWKLESHLLVLNTKTQKETIDTLASDLNANKARYISISPRNPNFNLVKPSFKFYESNVFYAKDMELFKTEASVTSSE